MPEKEDDEHAEDQPEPEEEEHTEDEPDEDEYGKAIDGLLERISQLEQHNAGLEQRIAELQQQLSEHGIKFKHEPIPESSGPGDIEPEPAHWYFKRLRRD